MSKLAAILVLFEIPLLYRSIMLRDCSFAFKFLTANHNASSIFSANRVEGALLESVQNFDGGREGCVFVPHHRKYKYHSRLDFSCFSVQQQRHVLSLLRQESR